jgi:hypothetical protein
MTHAWLRFLSVMMTATSMAAGLAHLFALPNKIGLSAADYLTVQQIYRGWDLLGIAVVGALATTAAWTVLARHRPGEFRLTLAATLCIALSLLVFFLFTYPANQLTRNWTTLPANWEELRRIWEYAHAVGAGLTVTALASLTSALLVAAGDGPGRPHHPDS